MKIRFSIDFEKDQHKMLKVESAETEQGMKDIVLQQLGQYFWERGKHFPGYQPDECHDCSYPISEHTLRSATSTEPGGLDCPAPDDEMPY